MKLAHALDDRLARLMVDGNAERRILFSQAIEDLRKESGKDAFYDLFKSTHNQISFVETSKRIYCIGALAHNQGLAQENLARLG